MTDKVEHSKDPIANYQKQFEAFWEQSLPGIAKSHSALQPMLEHHFISKGKFLRPALTMAFYNVLQKDQVDTDTQQSYPTEVLQTALAIEILHNATLVHDDLQDGDTHRRGVPTVWKQFDAYQAINTGSALYFHAVRLLSTLKIEPEIAITLTKVLSQQTLSIIAGQAAEKELWSQMDPKEFATAKALYLDTVQKKTSALFAIPLICAAVLSGKKSDLLPRLEGIALPLGALFQIQDDLLDLYGDKGRNSAGNDLAEGKPSFIALHALYHAPKEESQRLRTLLETPREECKQEEIDWAIQWLRDNGSLQASLDLIESLHKEAQDEIAQLQLHQSTEPLQYFVSAIYQKVLQPIQHLL
mgnify:CR=1 FL=1